MIDYWEEWGIVDEMLFILFILDVIEEMLF